MSSLVNIVTRHNISSFVNISSLGKNSKLAQYLLTCQQFRTVKTFLTIATCLKFVTCPKAVKKFIANVQETSEWSAQWFVFKNCFLEMRFYILWGCYNDMRYMWSMWSMWSMRGLWEVLVICLLIQLCAVRCVLGMYIPVIIAVDTFITCYTLEYIYSIP